MTRDPSPSGRCAAARDDVREHVRDGSVEARTGGRASGDPDSDLVETNRRRGRHEGEYELLDTGVFDQDRYFNV